MPGCTVSNLYSAMKEWDRIYVKAFGEASFNTLISIGEFLESIGYIEIMSGSGTPENAAPYWTAQYDRPVEEE